MPEVNETQLAEFILESRIAAITLDTSIFDRYQCNFGSPALIALEQFREKHLTLLISEIVAEEVKSHLDRDASKSQRELKSAIAAHIRRWRISDNPDSTYLLDLGAKEFAASQFQDFRPPSAPKSCQQLARQTSQKR